MMDTESFSLYIYSLLPLGYAAVEFLTYLLISFEAWLGVWLIIGGERAVVCRLCLVFIALMSAFLIWRIAIGDSGNCHCFGDSVPLSPGWSLVKNVLLIVALLIVGRGEGGTPIRRKWLPLSYVATLFAYCIVCPPTSLIRSEPSDIDREMIGEFIERPGDGDDVSLYVFLSPACKYCQKFMTKLDVMVRHKALPGEAVKLYFMDSDLSEEEIADFFDKYSEGNRYGYSLVPIDRFMAVTGGIMPVAAFTVGGRFVKEMDLISFTERNIRRVKEGEGTHP